ncbi:B12 binding domain protein [Pseudobythopirellula maris]|uniref:B12 binding domain protein n=1 Tax=Pseudobythopirellula maris TaxID=2527991 RepID=A0A5C5ZRA7_9BACT|nr:radical SAM protein [Pseudobythopirellula maris]TWT89820.1 B12 binding domain protein [Pseudobythopirellula maris]
MKFTMLMLEIRGNMPGFSGHYSEGVASIASVIKSAGHEFELMHVTRPIDPDELAERVAASGPDAIGYSCMTHTFRYLVEFAGAIRRRLPDTPSIMGGVHAILNPEESINVDGISAVSLGEGEAVILPFLDRVDRGESFADVPGIYAKEGGEITRNLAAPLITELDSLPAPDRSVFDFMKLVSTREGVLYVHCSRGCPYKCPFCCNEAIRDRAPNAQSYLRYKSVERVCEEIKQSLRYFPGKLHGIYFQDEILTMNKKWFREFAEVYPQRVGIPFNCNLRADLVSLDVAELLQQAGCNSVSLGLESGVERIRAEIVGKHIPDEQCHEAFRRLRDRGIQVNTFSMIGLPGETPKDALTTVFFNAESKIDKNMVSIFCPYPGTPLHTQALANGTLSSRMPDTFSDDTPMNQECISADQIKFIHDYFGIIVRLYRTRWPGKAIVGPLTRYVERDGWSLKALVSAKRALKKSVTAPYLWFGHYLMNRQAQVFRKGAVEVDCSHLSGPAAMKTSKEKPSSEPTAGPETVAPPPAEPQPVSVGATDPILPIVDPAMAVRSVSKN